MKILASVDDLPHDRPLALTIGMFDGVHRGHQRAIRALMAAARTAKASSVVLTFDPHPAQVLRGSAPPLLCSHEEKLARLAALGVDTTVVQPFDKEFADQPPERFLARVCSDRRLVALVMTAESAFGRDRTGVIETVRRLGTELKFRVVEVKRLGSEGGTLSSTRVRGVVTSGRLADARRLLGRPYAVTGTVVAGDRRGRDLGYPTANLAFDEPVTLPPDGIYAVRAAWGGRDPLQPRNRANGVASLGVRPTFGRGGDRVLEVHLFDFEGDMYGRLLRVEFVRRLRGEKKFSSGTALVRQMERDAVGARKVLNQDHQRTTGSTPRRSPSRSTSGRKSGGRAARRQP